MNKGPEAEASAAEKRGRTPPDKRLPPPPDKRRRIWPAETKRTSIVRKGR